MFSDICPGLQALWRNWSRLNYASHYLSDINKLLQSEIYPFEEIKSQIRALELNPDLTPTAAPYHQGKYMEILKFHESVC